MNGVFDNSEIRLNKLKEENRELKEEIKQLKKELNELREENLGLMGRNEYLEDRLCYINYYGSYDPGDE